MDIAQIQLTKSADDDLELITSDHHLQFTLPQQSHLQEQLEFQVFRKFGKVCVQALWSILSWRVAARSCCCFVLPAVVFLSLLQLFFVSGFPCIFFIQKKKKKKAESSAGIGFMTSITYCPNISNPTSTKLINNSKSLHIRS